MITDFEIVFNPYFILLACVVIFQLLLFILLFAKIISFKGYQDKDKEKQPVSVIICAKNEEDNLREFLPAVLDQDYPEYEVVVVNDQSTDKTLDVIQEFQEKNKHLNLINIEDHIRDHSGKKLALTLAIKKAKYDILMLTDADCKPVSNHWISNIVENYTAGTDIVLGVSVYERKNNLLNWFIQFETFFTIIQYVAFNLHRMTYMGVGRNLSYRKQVFFDHKGFSAHLHLSSGDDDLFVNKAATRMNTRVEVRPESFTLSKPAESFRDWFRQKKRHLQAGKEYSKKHIRWLGTVALLQFLFFVFFALGAFQFYDEWIFWAVIAMRYAGVFLVYFLNAKKLSLMYVLPFIIFSELIHAAIYVPLMSMITFFSKKRHGW